MCVFVQFLWFWLNWMMFNFIAKFCGCQVYMSVHNLSNENEILRSEQALHLLASFLPQCWYILINWRNNLHHMNKSTRSSRLSTIFKHTHTQTLIHLNNRMDYWFIMNIQDGLIFCNGSTPASTVYLYWNEVRNQFCWSMVCCVKSRAYGGIFVYKELFTIENL